LKVNHKITCAVLTALGAQACFAADAPDSSDALQTVTVTAQRRTESVQDVPITIQVLTGEQLQQLSVVNFEDVAKYLPNVSYGGNGPGQGDIFMRGLSAGGNGGNQSSASYLPFPNVALYLDDQSVQFPGRNLDIYLVDMERVEVLEGPQGTLFGGGAEAGAIRYITNKPKLDATSGNVQASYGITAHGDPNQSVNATLNLPLIEGVLALRGVIYNDHRGGYIDNLPSTFTRSNSDAKGGLEYPGIQAVEGVCPGYPISNGLPSSTGYCVPYNSQVANNYDLARNAQNPVNYGGIRVSGLLKINDDWNVLVTQSFQNMEADGSFAQYPYGSDYGVNPAAPQALGPWQGTFFAPSYYKDQFENTALTLNGKLGDLRLVYSGAYLVRHIEQSADYTNYTRSTSGYYYTCSGGSGTGFGTPGTNGVGSASTPAICYSPIASWYDQTRNDHLSNELRLSTPDDWRLRGLLGFYQENFNVVDNMNFLYRSIPECTAANLAVANQGGPVCVADIGPVPGSLDYDPNPRNGQVAYGEDERRGYSQYAAFTSIDFDLIPKVLTITGGTRYYHYHEYEFGTRYTTTENCQNVAVCVNGSVPTIYGGGNIIEPPNTTYQGFRSRGNLTWHITPDTMVYYTFSQGFRPGGFNRFQKSVGNIPLYSTDSGGTVVVTKGPTQFKSPYSYSPDSLSNHEVGWKTSWFEHRLEFNGSLYHMTWNNAQFIFFDPLEGFGNSNFVVNGPNYRINGVEMQLAVRPVSGLTLMASSAWNQSKLTNEPCLVANIGPNPGECITQTIKSGTVYNITAPLGELNSRPAFSPALQFSLRARYDWAFTNGYLGFLSVGASHVGEMSNEPVGYPKPTVPAGSTKEFFEQPGYTTYDASLGVSKDRWTATFYGQNLSNSDASTYTSSAQYIEMQVPLRPRVLGLKVDYQF
jgi:outer membrane receptor protein involved in Fe transport